MNYCLFKYIDFAKGGVNHRNNIQVITELERVYGANEIYRTIFRFDEKYKNYVEQNKSVKGFRGKCYADWFPLDIDDKDLDAAWHKTLAFINLLKYDYEYDVKHIFFSGSKGFHILIPIQCFGFVQPNEKMPQIFKNIYQDIAADFADSSIYEINRLFRMTNTRNAKSDLFKIPLTVEEFHSGIENIKRLAEKPHAAQQPALRDSVVNNQFQELYQKYLNENVSDEIKKETADLFTKLSGVEAGERDTTATRLVGFLKSKNVEPELAYQWLRGWNLQCTPPMDEEQLQKIISSVYSYQKDESQIESEIKPIWAIYDEYAEFVNGKRRVDIGIPEIDRKMRGIRPGQILTILGYTGNYKSATLQEILRHYHHQTQEPVIMFELEMSRLDVFERACQMEARLSGRDVEAAFKDEDHNVRNGLVELLENRQKNFYIVDASGLNFEDMRNYIKIAEEKILKRKINLIGIDFLQLMTGDGRTKFEQMNNISVEMKNFAKELDIALVTLSQVTGVESSEDVVKAMDARDSKTIIQMSDYVICLYLKEMTEEERNNGINPIQVIDLQKNRKGRTGKVLREIEQRTLTFINRDEHHTEPF